MNCARCGTRSSEGDVFCRTCGLPLNQAAPGSPPRVSAPPVSVYVQQRAAGGPRTSGFAVASLVLGLIGFSILAIIFGGVAIGQAEKDPNLSGKGMAVAGLVLGSIELVIELLAVFFFIGVFSFL
jgi:hypothetical protein